MEKNCKNCRYYDSTYCVRCPPKQNDGFPRVGSLSWCGEFNPVTDNDERKESPKNIKFHVGDHQYNTLAEAVEECERVGCVTIVMTCEEKPHKHKFTLGYTDDMIGHEAWAWLYCADCKTIFRGKEIADYVNGLLENQKDESHD